MMIVAGAGMPLSQSIAEFAIRQGQNPHPVRLVRPAAKPLSAMARLGRMLFYDPGLSSSGQLACASCHSPQHHYGPPNGLPAMRGGPQLSRQGVRAVPSLMYLERQPSFTIGPDKDEDEGTSLAQMIAASRGAARRPKTANHPSQSATAMVPQGGLFWDGRVDTLQDQALVPLLNPIEMDGGGIAVVAGKLKRAPYAAQLEQLFGGTIFDSPRAALSEALFAIARYQIEEVSFHPYTSKFDFWLEDKARFGPSQMRGYLLFNDKAKANCGGCHVGRVSGDRLPPLFTDRQFEALGVPRNPALNANRNPHNFDLGICGPYRADMARQTQYCGYFGTPTLRNVATRQVFFHNGVYHSLRQVLGFYDFRDPDPGKIYPRGTDGRIDKFNDLPPRYRTNVDTIDPPFNRHAGEAPAITAQDEADIIAFLGTLTDGYRRQHKDASAN